MGPIRVYDFAEKHMYWNLDCSCVINTEKKLIAVQNLNQHTIVMYRIFDRTDEDSTMSFDSVYCKAAFDETLIVTCSVFYHVSVMGSWERDRERG